MTIGVKDFPFSWSRTVTNALPDDVLFPFVRLLSRRGYRIEETDAGFDAVHDTVLNSAERRTGKRRLIGAGVLVLVVMVAVMMGEGDSRELLSPVLFAAVVLGGLGLNKFKDPVKIHRRIVRVEASVAKADVALRVGEGVAEVEGQLTFGWLDDATAEIDESTYDELMMNVVTRESGEAKE